MNILGISCYFHDSAATLLHDGEIVAAAEEERFSRKKHDYGFPTQAIDFCLEMGSVRAQDLDLVVFFEKPFLKFDRIIRSAIQTFPRSRRVFQESMITWLSDKLWIKHTIIQYLGVPEEKVVFSKHHLSHAASAFFCSPFDEAAILTVDGVGEWATTTYGVGKGAQISIKKEIPFPHSLGLLYSAFTAFLGFEVNEGEYKVMGMAPFGQPRYTDKVWKLIRLHDDGSFELDLDFFSFHYSPTESFNQKFVDLWGQPRAPEANFFTPGSGYPSYFGRRPDNFDTLAKVNEHYADVAASIQAVTEDVLLHMAGALQKMTGLKHLCMAGGVALNSVANGKILRKTDFEEIFIQPAAGDGGGAMGAALYGYHMLMGKPRTSVMSHAYLGKEYSAATIDTFLREQDIAHCRLGDAELVEQVVDHLTDGKVIGWLQNRFEWGPRALGHRSILADPRRAEMKEIVNTKIKFREPFRPFAPSVLADRAHEFFDIQEVDRHYPARYMLYVVDVLDKKKDQLLATTHVDGTARLQAVYEQAAPRYYQLIEAFGAATGVPVVLNTSFNLRGEPIVNTPSEAYQTFVRSEMDMLVLGNCLIRK